MVENFVQPGQTVEFEISNEQIRWQSPQAEGKLESPYIFALNDQAKVEGQVNRDLFIGIGRVISGTGRSGYGVSAVEVECLP